MQAQEYRKKTIQDLQKLLKSLKEEIKQNTESVLSGKEKNIKKNKYVKKQIARIQTVIAEKHYIASMEKEQENSKKDN